MIRLIHTKNPETMEGKIYIFDYINMKKLFAKKP